MIWPLPRTGPSSRCRLQLITKIRLSSFSRAARPMAPSVSGSSVSPSPRNAQTLRRGGFLQPAILEVAIEAGLVDRHDGSEAHRHGRELPELRHQPGVRVRRQAAALLQLLPEVRQLLDRQAPFEERARVDAGRRVALEVDLIPVAVLVLAAEEMVEGDLVERRGRGVGGNVTADPVRRAVGADHHRHRVPSHQALDAALDLLAARDGTLVFHADGVDVGRDRRERQAGTRHAGMVPKPLEQALHAVPVTLLDDVVERLEPLALFESLELGGVAGCDIAHLIMNPRSAWRFQGLEFSGLQSSYSRSGTGSGQRSDSPNGTSGVARAFSRMLKNAS